MILWTRVICSAFGKKMILVSWSDLLSSECATSVLNLLRRFSLFCYHLWCHWWLFCSRCWLVVTVERQNLKWFPYATPVLLLLFIRERERASAHSHMLVHSPKVWNSQDWAGTRHLSWKLNLGANYLNCFTQNFHMSTGSQAPGLSPTAFPGTFAGHWFRSDAAGTEAIVHTEWPCCRKWLNLLCNNARASTTWVSSPGM